MSSMELPEVKERFSESLKRAASAARELAMLQKYPVWGQIALSLDGMRQKGETMTRMRSISKSELDSQIDEHKAKMAVAGGEILQ